MMASKTAAKSGAGKADKPTLLSGGNPQIPKGEGDGPVQAYIAAMPGWKRDVGRSLDALIVRTVPGVRKAVKWNSPFYGIEGQGWFLSYHCFTKYVKITFLRGTSLDPLPPGKSKHEHVRYLDIHEDDEFDDLDWDTVDAIAAHTAGPLPAAYVRASRARRLVPSSRSATVTVSTTVPGKSRASAAVIQSGVISSHSRGSDSSATAMCAAPTSGSCRRRPAA